MESDRLVNAFRDRLKLYDGRITSMRHTETCWTLDYYSADGGFIETWQLSHAVEDEDGISFDPTPLIDLTNEQERIFNRLWPRWEEDLRWAKENSQEVAVLIQQSLGHGDYWTADPDLRTWYGNSLDAMEQFAERLGFKIEWELIERGGLISGKAQIFGNKEFS